MRLSCPQRQHLQILQTWFPTAHDLTSWGGRDLVMSEALDEFRDQLKLDILHSRVLLHDDGAMLGFGQYYERLGRVHLGRLAIAPQARGRGLVRTLVEALLLESASHLTCRDASLFVMDSNLRAIRAYRKLGFSYQRYPATTPGGGDSSGYMVLSDFRRLLPGRQPGTC